MEYKTLEQHKEDVIQNLLTIALNEEGYLEKRSNTSLYEKTSNAGYNNYTKYANDLTKNNFYNGSMNGLAWCDMFVDWCFTTAFGKSDAQLITYQKPYGSAACYTSKSFYKKAGKFFTKPQPGDQIFFNRSHTGLVYKVSETTVYTIEGNTSASRGVVANGGAVKLKEYPINSPTIAGYGRPNYDIVAQKVKENHDLQVEKYLEELVKQEILSKLEPKIGNNYNSLILFEHYEIT
jgi:hypothetical protein